MILGGGFPIFGIDDVESTISAYIIGEAIKTSAFKHDWLDYAVAIGTMLTGLGALGFGFGAVKTLPTIFNLLKLKNKQHKLKKKYPVSKLGKEYYLWKTPNDNPWWLIDLGRKSRHHVRPYQTVEILGWEHKYREVDRQMIEAYPEGEEINATRI